MCVDSKEFCGVAIIEKKNFFPQIFYHKNFLLLAMIRFCLLLLLSLLLLLLFK